jgi:hypothetical protein
MTGVSCIQYYSPQIFASIGIDTDTTLGLQSGNSVIALIGEVLCILYIDRLGRRWPLITANALSGLTFVVGTAIIAIFPAGSNNQNASRAFVAMTWLFNVRRRPFARPRLRHADQPAVSSFSPPRSARSHGRFRSRCSTRRHARRRLP